MTAATDTLPAGDKTDATARRLAVQALATGTGAVLVTSSICLFVGSRVTGIRTINDFHAAFRRRSGAPDEASER